ncbi:MAG: heavy-metal-associated domain-containing protein [Leptospirales bacterium]
MRNSVQKLLWEMAILAGLVLLSENALAAEKKISLKLGGQYCGFYLDDVEKALKKVPGVAKVSFNGTQDRVTVIGNKIKAKDLVSAVDKVKGSSWYCKAKLQ